ncbi:MAG TPA: 16S rRNA (adenine(1518)-N(6)/adenine(1519)-N(6))-dimethyltransferase RsmA [Candidatus Solibacter sp.]|nr:16S rRNA (adenine(1518)-N(6)/adenine(1519)-N(6))-dimethyltransferase RsmA [Candidatus Solibacter sp.]
MPRKLGQHFLYSDSILDRIADAVCPRREELVIEIGPGRGALTAKLLERADRVIAIEVDAALVEHLRATFPALEVIHTDVLSADLAQWGRVPIAGNLPYYITSPILEKSMRANPARAVFLMQKEVAQRLTAKPGSRDYGFLTVQTAIFAAARTLFDVKPGAFRPPPKVDSSVVLLEPHAAPVVPDPATFLEFASRAFRQKRKTLRNNLAVHYPAIQSQPEASMRAEQLSVNDLRTLFTRVLSPSSPDAPPGSAPAISE